MNFIKEKAYYLALIILFLNVSLYAQNGGWWEPAFPIKGDSITIYFDATQNGEIPDNVTSLVLHWGVNEITTGNWQTPPTYLWPAGTVLHSDNVAARSPMTKTGGIWQITIPTDNTISSVHFVVNDGTPSTPGSNWGHSTGGANWNITFTSSQVTAVFINPVVNNTYNDPERSPAFASLGDTVQIQGTAGLNNTQLDSLKLFVNNQFVAKTDADTIEYSFITANFGVGFSEISLIAKDTAGVIDTAFAKIMVNPATKNASVPASIEDGINYINSTTVTLSLYAPYKEFVYVLGDFNDWKIDTTYFMKRDVINSDSVRWWLTIPGLSAGIEYAFQYLVDGEVRIADPYTEKILDPWNDSWISSSTYPNLKNYPSGKTNEAVSILQTNQSQFNWIYSDTFSRPPQHEIVIYELLVRDFIANHDYSTLMDTLDYLQNLGINAIELMPINEFEGNSSWGYNPSFYFAPDKYYGPEENLKMFIDECHGRGIAVIMDIVLNHSYGQSPLVRLFWDDFNNRPAANNPWYNIQSPNPVFSWGYDFNHESQATKTFVDRVNRFWLTEYKFDGFRFDFTKGFTNTPGDGGAYDLSRISILKRMADKIWETDSAAYVILEHFADNYEERELAAYGMMLWGNSNYNYNEATMGWHSNSGSDFSWGYYGMRGWTKPNLVTYMESHDEERLMYKNLLYGNSSGGYNVQDTATALNRIKLAAAFFFTYPGPKMVWQFQEFGYDYSIDYNGRVGEKPIRWDYLSNQNRNYLYKTFAALTKLRKENDVFTSPQTLVQLWLGDSYGRKRIKLTHPSMNVIIIGNFDVVNRSMNPDFHTTGWWYDYFSGDSINITNVSDYITLTQGEFHIYSDHRIDPPEQGILNSVVTNNSPSVVKSYELYQNYPNPFNPVTNIEYNLPKNEHVQLEIFNVNGEKVITLVNAIQQSGNYNIQWNGINSDGNMVSSGLYFYRLKTNDYVKTNKMILMR